MTVPTILGVDPGARTVGAVLRRGPTVLRHGALERLDPLRPLEDWVDQVIEGLHDLVRPLSLELDVVAVEGVNAPSPYMGLTNVAGLLDTAAIVGVVAGWAWTDAVPTMIVPPDRFGAPVEGLTGHAARQVLLQRYPSELVGPRETTGSGKGPLQHVRAAYDVAGAAALRLRMEAA